LIIRDEHNRLEEQRRMLDQEMEMVLQQRKAAEELAKVCKKFLLFSLRSIWIHYTGCHRFVHFMFQCTRFTDYVLHCLRINTGMIYGSVTEVPFILLM